MGNSTTTLQSVFDYLQTMGELSTVLPVGGFSTLASLGMATDVMRDFFGNRNPWKFNRMKCPAFYTNSWQQDYAQIGLTTVDWLENGQWVDINNTAKPLPTYPVEAVRDIQPRSITGLPPAQCCWKYNSELIQGSWPGAQQTYTNPIGVLSMPSQGPTNILDAHGNILVLTTYGVTGNAAPLAAQNAPEGTVVNDGSVVWTVASPNSQGFRINPMPPQQGVVYQVNMIGQVVAPAAFTSMQALINPIPDNFAHYFIAGCVAYSYRNSPNPAARKDFEAKRLTWLQNMAQASAQGDKEVQAPGFIPDRSVVSPQGGYDIGPANPFLYNVWPGR